MFKNVTILFICLIPGCLFAQNTLEKTKIIDTAGKKDLIDIGRTVLGIKTKPVTAEKGRSFYFSILPVSTAVPGGGRALFTSTTAGFYAGSNRNTTYISTLTFAPYFNFKGRYGLPLRSNIWLKNNSWNIQGDTRFLVYPQYTWGLGGRSPQFHKFLVNYNYVRLYQSALKRVTSYFYAGLGYNMDYYMDIETKEPNALLKYTGYRYGTTMGQNSFSSGVTLNLLYDTRNNAINPLPGSYANLIYRVNTNMLGSNTNWQSLYLDFRKYVDLTDKKEQNVLAFWTYYWTTLTKRVPYLNLPSIGWEPNQRSGRGIDQNRYRGGSLLYFESEYRRDITYNGLLGFVIFANVNSVNRQYSTNFRYWNPAAGAGLRIKFNKGSNTNIALDYGFSKGYSNVILGLGEAF